MTTAIVQRDVLVEEYPSATTLVTVTGAQTVIIGPKNLLRFDKKTFSVKNVGATAFTTLTVQATAIESPVGTPSTADADWEDINTAGLVNLGAGGYKSVQIAHDSRKWWRVVGQTGGGTTTARGYLTAGAV